MSRHDNDIDAARSAIRAAYRHAVAAVDRRFGTLPMAIREELAELAAFDNISHMSQLCLRNGNPEGLMLGRLLAQVSTTDAPPSPIQTLTLQ